MKIKTERREYAVIRRFDDGKCEEENKWEIHFVRKDGNQVKMTEARTQREAKEKIAEYERMEDLAE